MVRRSVFRGALTILALLGARVASADPINFTGHVGNDFNPDTDKSVTVVPGLSNPLFIGQPDWMTNAGWYSGWAIKDIRTSYDSKTDVLSVGVNTFTNPHGTPTIAGDAYGSGTQADPNLQQRAGGVNPPSFGGDKSITLAFAPDGPDGTKSPGTPVIVAGIPADKSVAGTGTIDGFTVSTYNGLNLGLASNYGTKLPSNTGNLAFDPNLDHPGFEFTIKNFSKIPGLDPSKGYWIEAYAGSAQDRAVGETQLPFYRIPGLAGQTIGSSIPEPTTIVAWTVVIGGAIWRLRRRPAKD
ncbi:MAG TPA: hypothetical protein VKP69_25135 [Isosphaeraceae bacterium]|nr:hypothetical protein [Isosphaeraceae bacterium]